MLRFSATGNAVSYSEGLIFMTNSICGTCCSLGSEHYSQSTFEGKSSYILAGFQLHPLPEAGSLATLQSHTCRDVTRCAAPHQSRHTLTNSTLDIECCDRKHRRTARGQRRRDDKPVHVAFPPTRCLDASETLHEAFALTWTTSVAPVRAQGRDTTSPEHRPCTPSRQRAYHGLCIQERVRIAPHS